MVVLSGRRYCTSFGSKEPIPEFPDCGVLELNCGTVLLPAICTTYW